MLGVVPVRVPGDAEPLESTMPSSDFAKATSMAETRPPFLPSGMSGAPRVWSANLGVHLA